jgi:hypothetical protein
MKHPSIILIVFSGLAGPLAASEVLLNLDNPSSYISNTYTNGDVAATFATTGWDGGLRSYWQLGNGSGNGYGTSLSAGAHLQMDFSMAGGVVAPQLTRFKISYALDSMTSLEIPDASMNSLIMQYFNGATYIGEQNLGISTTNDFEQTATITTVPPGTFDRVRLVPGFSWTSPVTQTDVLLNLDNEAAYANNTYTANNVSLTFATDGWDGGLRSYWHLGGGSGFGYGTSLGNGQALKVAVSSTESMLSTLKPVSFMLRAAPDFGATLNSVQVSYYHLGSPVGGQTFQGGGLDFGQSVVVNAPGSVDEIRVVPSFTAPLPETVMFDLNNEASFNANIYSVDDKRISFSTQGWDGGLRSYWQLGAGAGLGYGTSLTNGQFVQLNLSTLGSGTNLRIQSFKLEVELEAFDAINPAVDSVTLRYYQGGVLVGEQDAGISTTYSSGLVTITPTYAGAFDSMRIQTALSGTPGEFSSISAMVVVDEIQFQSTGNFSSGSAMIEIDEIVVRKTTETHVTPSMFLVVDDLVVVVDELAAALDAPNLSWTSSGNAGWVKQSLVTHDGVDAAQSGDIGDSQTSTLESTINSGGVLSFWWKVDSEPGFDFLRFYLDGVEQPGALGISGLTGWQFVSITVPNGSHTLRWVYAKDSSVSTGADGAWVDEVSFTPLSGFALWTAQNIPVGRDASFLGDWNADGVSNGISYVFGNTRIIPLGGNAAGTGRVPAPGAIPPDVDVYLELSAGTQALNAWVPLVSWVGGAPPVFHFPGYTFITNGEVVDTSNAIPFFYRYRIEQR